jgi:hypothetical protein
MVRIPQLIHGATFEKVVIPGPSEPRKRGEGARNLQFPASTQNCSSLAPLGVTILDEKQSRRLQSLDLQPAIGIPLWLAQILHNHRNSLPSTDAGSCQPILLLAPLQLIQQGDNQPRARCAQRMSQGNRTAVDIDLLTIQP